MFGFKVVQVNGGASGEHMDDPNRVPGPSTRSSSSPNLGREADQPARPEPSTSASTSSGGENGEVAFAQTNRVTVTKKRPSDPKLLSLDVRKLRSDF